MKTQNKKSKFRASSEWKSFRKKMKEKQKVDFITGKPLYKGFNLHHLDLDEKHYEDISNEDNFVCLNQKSHYLIHFLFRYKEWRQLLKNTETLLERMEKINDNN